MSNIYGPKTKEVLNAGDLLKFKDVPLMINKSVPKINPGQFFTSLANNMRSRLFTTQATHVSKNKNEFKDQFENILKDLNVLDPNNWPDNIDIQYGDDSIRRLANKFHLNEVSTIRGFREFKDLKDSSKIPTLNPLLTAISTIAVSSSECERSFSSMNNIITPKRNVLNSEHIASLVFISCVGPPVQLFKPDHYVKSWIKMGKRSAEETRCPKRDEHDIDHSYKHLWAYLNL